MIIPTGNRYFVEIKQASKIGGPWIVTVHRKSLFFKRKVSSDWFLDEAQARTFAQALAAELRDERAAATLKQRKPGWTLHRAPR